MSRRGLGKLYWMYLPRSLPSLPIDLLPLDATSPVFPRHFRRLSGRLPRTHGPVRADAFPSVILDRCRTTTFTPTCAESPASPRDELSVPGACRSCGRWAG